MVIPLIETTDGQHGAATSDQQHRFSVTSQPASNSTTSSTPQTGTGSRRELVTVHVGSSDVALAQEDLELALVLVQTLVLLAWVYREVYK